MSQSDNPMADADDWEANLLQRYPESSDGSKNNRAASDSATKPEEAFRNFEAETRSSVKEFYRLNHHYQSVDFVREKRREFLQLRLARMGIWEAMEFLNKLVDDSDPDTDLSQIEHLLQTAEAIRSDGHPRWFVLTGLIHDLGKVLCLFGEPQWAVVGDTFPVGCAFSPKIVYHEFFRENPDWDHPIYSGETGVYEVGTGLKNVQMSWGHDEYLYHVTRNYLPIEAQYMIRYHSFYPAHRERAYEWMFDRDDMANFEWVRRFNPYDLYSKSDVRPDVAALKPYYLDLIAEFFPDKIAW